MGDIYWSVFSKGYGRSEDTLILTLYWYTFIFQICINTLIPVGNIDSLLILVVMLNGWHSHPTWVIISHTKVSLQWRHNEHDGVSNHQPHDCILNRLFRRRSKKTSKLRVTGLCAGNSPVTGEFPAQIFSNGEMFPLDYVIMDIETHDLYLTPHPYRD